MKNTIMFMTIGKLDCNLVYEDAVQGSVRCPTSIKDLTEFDKLDALDPQECKNTYGWQQ